MVHTAPAAGRAPPGPRSKVKKCPGRLMMKPGPVAGTVANPVAIYAVGPGTAVAVREEGAVQGVRPCTAPEDFSGSTQPMSAAVRVADASAEPPAAASAA